ncbi:hypothetical protein [Candidatus Methylomicrobium oryzae]|uniref:hypothetical protein n=1 Tax=Candidatus Methylomicrobium oryzae TaxID=2802053 RepID=UPI001923138C|nr:hypothetical protein [Methylomicrobium sp. RS1]MBL1263877.1 hypothetical protein [Methylomicrobium sp. RS1]
MAISQFVSYRGDDRFLCPKKSEGEAEGFHTNNPVSVFLGDLMLKRITNRSERSEDGAAARQKAKRRLVIVLKALIRGILLRPSTWRMLIVNLPDLGEKIEGFIQQLLDLFPDF